MKRIARRLAAAHGLVKESGQLVELQKETIAGLKRRQVPTREAEALLAQLENAARLARLCFNLELQSAAAEERDRLDLSVVELDATMSIHGTGSGPDDAVSD